MGICQHAVQIVPPSGISSGQLFTCTKGTDHEFRDDEANHEAHVVALPGVKFYDRDEEGKAHEAVAWCVVRWRATDGN